MKKRNTAVELLRIIGSLMVIGTHAKMGVVVNGQVSFLQTLFACLVGDGVAFFWMILGFFYFSGDYKTHLKKTAQRVLIPLIVFSALWFFFFDFVTGQKGLLDSIIHPLSDYISVTKGIFRWENTLNGAEHFWFMYVYVLVVLMFPTFKSLRDHILLSEKGDLRLLLVFGGALILNDIVFNELFDFSFHTLSGALCSSVFIFTGDILYRNREKFIGNRKTGFLALLGAAFVLIVRTFMQYRLYLFGSSIHPLLWYTSFAYFSVIFLSVAVFAFCGNAKEDTVSAQVIRYLGSRTFYIYIIHVLFLYSVPMNRLRDRIFGVWMQTETGILLCEIIWTLVVFLCSLVVSELMMQIKKGTQMLLQVFVKKRQNAAS